MLPRTTDDLASQRAAIARATRSGDLPEADRLRTEYRTAKIEDYIRRTVDEAPPLTDEQRRRLARLLLGGEVA